MCCLSLLGELGLTVAQGTQPQRGEMPSLVRVAGTSPMSPTLRQTCMNYIQYFLCMSFGFASCIPSEGVCSFAEHSANVTTEDEEEAFIE